MNFLHTSQVLSRTPFKKFYKLQCLPQGNSLGREGQIGLTPQPTGNPYILIWFPGFKNLPFFSSVFLRYILIYFSLISKCSFFKLNSFIILRKFLKMYFDHIYSQLLIIPFIPDAYNFMPVLFYILYF